MIDEFELFRARAYGVRDDSDDKPTDDVISVSASQRRTCNAVLLFDRSNGQHYGLCPSFYPFVCPFVYLVRALNSKTKVAKTESDASASQGRSNWCANCQLKVKVRG